MRVGLFGGTFNPPHIGHRLIAEHAVEALALERLFWIPANRSPLKDDYADPGAQHRLAMTRIAAAGHALFRVSTLELDRPAPSYMIDTLRLLKGRNPDWSLVLLIGADSWETFPRWREPLDIRELAEVVVYPRPGVGPGATDDVRRLDAPEVAVASTDIRERLRLDRPIAGFLQPEVAAYVQRERLYVPS